MAKETKILALGDVVGERAHALICSSIGALKRRFGADLVIVNGENASLGTGNGITGDQARELVFAGADVITTGNHVFAQRSLYNLLDEADNILRPANYPPECPGKGDCIIEANSLRFLVANVSGRIAMNENSLSSPFDVSDAILERNRGKFDAAIFDFHAEATSEKFVFASYLDGRAGAVFGTHTHVGTSDCRILPGGCAFITDIGMCGPRDSAIGVDEKIILEMMKTGMPQKFRVSDKQIFISGALFIFDANAKTVGAQAFSLSEKEISER